MTSLCPLFLAAALALTALTACDPRPFNAEVGASMDEGQFGDATTVNTAAMMGEGQATQMLGRRFAAEVPNTITFAFNSDQLTPQAMATLARQASWIRRFPEVRFSVYGYTDLVGTEAYNKGLGLRRAQAAVAYLVSQGAERGKLQALVSYGETRPVVMTPAPEQRNRRAVTGVSGFARGYAGLLNGKYAAIIMREYVESATRPHVANTKVSTSLATAQ